MLGDPLVNGDESQALHSRLCDEHAVKRVAVMGRERSGGQRVSRCEARVSNALAFRASRRSSGASSRPAALSMAISQAEAAAPLSAYELSALCGLDGAA